MTGLFENLDYESSLDKTASRKALLLSQTRVEYKLGSFLKAASTKPEFDARFSYVEDSFYGIVKEACNELGVDDSTISQTVKNQYERIASMPKRSHSCGNDNCGPNCHCSSDCDCEGDDCPCDHDFDDHEDKESSIKNSNKYVEKRGDKWVVLNKDGKVISTHDSKEKAEGSFRAIEYYKHEGAIESDKKHWIQDAVKHPGLLHKELDVPEDEKIPEDKLEEAEHSDNKKERERAQFAENMKHIHKGSDDKKEKAKGEHDPGEQDDEKDDEWSPSVLDVLESSRRLADLDVVERDGKYHVIDPDGDEDGGKPGATMKICDSKEEAHNWLEHYKREHTAAGRQDNTGLSNEPSPKMDKRLWTPESVEKLDVPSKQHPTVEKDVVQPIVGKNDDPLEEVGEKTTESQALPTSTNDSDAGFAPNNQPMAPHTKTWPDKDQTSPVTNTSLSHLFVPQDVIKSALR